VGWGENSEKGFVSQCWLKVEDIGVEEWEETLRGRAQYIVFEHASVLASAALSRRNSEKQKESSCCFEPYSEPAITRTWDARRLQTDLQS